MPLTSKPHQFTSTVQPYVYWNNVFSDIELAKVTEYCDGVGVEQSVTFNKGTETQTVDHSYRKSQSRFHDCNDSNNWIFEKLLAAMDSANKMFFQYDLVGFDNFQYTSYSDSEYYHYHTDTFYGEFPIDKNTHLSRKLSASLIISDQADYDGGEFHICLGDPNKPHILNQRKGTMLIFPSNILHRVTPVTRGVRKSIVVWTLGPKFR